MIIIRGYKLLLINFVVYRLHYHYVYVLKIAMHEIILIVIIYR